MIELIEFSDVNPITGRLYRPAEALKLCDPETGELRLNCGTAEFRERLSRDIHDEYDWRGLSLDVTLYEMCKYLASEDEKPLFGHVENKSARKELRRQFSSLVRREVRRVNHVLLNNNHGAKRESHRAVGAKGRACVNAPGRASGGSGDSSDDDDGSDSSDEPDPPAPIARARNTHSINPSPKKKSQRYINRPLCSRSCRVSRNNGWNNGRRCAA
jgi:hypothetical protein